MNVHCPTCETGYEIPPLLRPRRLRCTHCATEWRETPTDAPASEPPVPDLDPEPTPDPGLAPIAVAAPIADTRLAPLASPARDRRTLLLWLALWTLSLLLVAGCLFALWHWRDAIGHHWPPLLRLYQLTPGPVPHGTAPR